MALTKMLDDEICQELRTNTIIEGLAEGARLEAAKVAASYKFGSYGDIMDIEVEEDKRRVMVSFYSVKAAARAFTAAKGRQNIDIRFGAQRGHRSVNVPAEFIIEPDELNCVSAVEDDDSGTCTVLEFFDVRDARRMESKVSSIPQAAL